MPHGLSEQGHPGGSCPTPESTHAPVLLHSLPWPVSSPHVPCTLARSLLQCWAQDLRAPLGGGRAHSRPCCCPVPRLLLPTPPGATVPAPQACTQPGPGPPRKGQALSWVLHSLAWHTGFRKMSKVEEGGNTLVVFTLHSYRPNPKYSAKFSACVAIRYFSFFALQLKGKKKKMLPTVGKLSTEPKTTRVYNTD